MNAFVHDLYHCTKLQLSNRCSFGVMTQTRHKFQEFQSGKSVRTGICTIEREKKPNLHIALMNCVFLTVISIRPQMFAVLAVQQYSLITFLPNKLNGKRGVAVGEA